MPHMPARHKLPADYGEGKTKEQEAYDSSVMLGLVLTACALFIGGAIALALIYL